MRVAAVALASEVGDDGAGRGRQGDDSVLVAHGSGSQFVLVYAGLFFADEAPEFVQFQPVGPNADHHAVMQFGTAATDAKRQPGDRLAVGAGEARDGALADAFTQGGNDLDLLFAREGCSWRA